MTANSIGCYCFVLCLPSAVSPLVFAASEQILRQQSRQIIALYYHELLYIISGNLSVMINYYVNLGLRDLVWDAQKHGWKIAYVT